MRKALTVLLLSALAFTLACGSQPTSNGNGNANISSGTTPLVSKVRRAEITFIYTAGTTPSYEIRGPNPLDPLSTIDPDDPTGLPSGPIGAFLTPKDTIRWIVTYTAPGDAPPINITLDNFVGKHEGSPVTDPFEGDDYFVITDILPNTVRQVESKAVKTLGSWKYAITVNLGTLATVKADPMVRISDVR